MTNSRSRASINSLVALVAALVIGLAGHAFAGRKRVVVLDFEGPKAEKFHDDVVKLIKKSHNVIPTDKWNGTAEELDAGKVTAKNVKTVAKKLKIDGVITGKVEKRRDEYILRLTLRGGKNGEQVGNGVDTKAEGPKLDGKALRDVKEELVDAIDQLDANRGASSDDDDDDADKPAAKKKPVAKKPADDDDDDKPAPKKKPVAKKPADDDDDDKPAPKKKPPATAKKPAADDDDDDKPAAKKGFAKKGDQVGGDKVGAAKKPAAKDDDDADSPLPKGKATKKPAADDGDDDDKKKPKKVAAKDDDGGTEVEATTEPAGKAIDESVALTPANRAIDAVLGLSVTQRKLQFTYSSGLGNTPPGYRGVPVAGAMLDTTIYPLAISHTRSDILKNLGFTILFDKVLHISSQVKAADGTSTKLATSEQRIAIGASFRYPVGPAVVGVMLRAGQQSFSIDPGTLMASQVDIPNVGYVIIDPEAFVRYAVTPKITINASIGYEYIPTGGDINDGSEYGKGSTSGFEGQVSVDYSFTKNIFARAAFNFETIAMTFNNSGTLANNRDNDPTTQDVFGARDTYLGGAVTVGYAY